MSFKLQLISVAFNDIRCILKFDSLLGGGGDLSSLRVSSNLIGWLTFLGNLLPH